MEDGLPPPSEELRKKLLAQELSMRSKQPPHWAKTKYRKYSAMLNKKAEKEIAELLAKKKESEKNHRQAKKSVHKTKKHSAQKSKK